MRVEGGVPAKTVPREMHYLPLPLSHAAVMDFDIQSRGVFPRLFYFQVLLKKRNR